LMERKLVKAKKDITCGLCTKRIKQYDYYVLDKTERCCLTCISDKKHKRIAIMKDGFGNGVRAYIHNGEVVNYERG
jgi:hypothetical protein